jgi:hypothetical protein
MKTVLKKVGGWTPIIDTLASIKDKSGNLRYGVTGAAIFGVVWRHCQMKDGICRASQETLGELIGVHSRMTMNKYLKRLVADGYLIDTTPGLRHKPHVYKDAGRLNWAYSVEVEASNGNPESEPETGVQEMDTPNNQIGVHGGVHDGVHEMDISSTNKTIKYEKKAAKKAAATTTPVASQQFNNAAISTHSGLHEKIKVEILKDYETADDIAIDDAIRIWTAECKNAKVDGKDWKPTNIDAILERYDTIVLSTKGLLDRSSTYIRRTFEPETQENSGPKYYDNAGVLHESG